MNFKVIVAFIFCFFSDPLLAQKENPLQVVTTIPDLAFLVKEIGKSEVKVTSLLNGRNNPHYADAVPEYVRLVANADALCFVGLNLEVGYLPAILKKAANSKIQKGGSGYCEASMGIPILDKISTPVDRSMGDVHPEGNPHFYLSPGAMISAGQNCLDILKKLKPSSSQFFEKNFEKLRKELVVLGEQNKKKIAEAGLNNLEIIEYHKEFAYFFQFYGFKSGGSIEEKPGVSPSAGRLHEIAKNAKAAKIQLALAADYNPKDILRRFEELSQITAVVVPTMIQEEPNLESYKKLQQKIVDEIIIAKQKKKNS